MEYSTTEVVRRTTYQGSEWKECVSRAKQNGFTGQIILHTSQGTVCAAELVEKQTLPVDESP